DGLLYRSGRIGGDHADPIFQAIDPDILAVTDIPLSGSPTDEIIALTHAFGNTLLGADVGNRLFSLTTAGVRTLIGPMKHLARGLVALDFKAAPPTRHQAELPLDFDGDKKRDIAIYRDGGWFILRSSDGGVTFRGWGGLPQDKPVPGDYDGDGKTDQAVYRNGAWWILRSSDGGAMAMAWGGAAQDIARPGCKDGE